MGRAVLLRELVEHDEQLGHQMDGTGKRPLIAMHTADIGDLSRQVEHAAVGIQDVRALEERLERLTVETPLEQLEKRPPGARQMMDGSIRTRSHAVLKLQGALLSVDIVELGEQSR